MAFKIQICRMPIQIDRGLFKFDFTDYYAVLGVPIDGSKDQVRRRYYQIAGKLHPDKFKSKNDAEKQQASEIFSKLVNPAYEKLSKQKGRAEYAVLLSDLNQKLVSEGSNITFTTEAAQRLGKSQGDLELTYKKLLQNLAFGEYQSLDLVVNYITQISELNLSYLILQKSQNPQPQVPKIPAKTIKVEQSHPNISIRKPSNQENKDTHPEKSKQTVSQDTATSSINASVRRAQGFIKRQNFANAILELREALKKEPNNGICHGLLGVAYLQQNQLSMAKVHINRAWKLSPNEPLVIEGKRELNKIEKEGGLKKGKDSNQSKGGGLFGNLFGGKNKNR